MDHQEQHHQHHQKEREQKKHEQHAHEQQQEKSALPFHPKWLFVAGFVLTLLAILVYTFIVWI